MARGNAGKAGPIATYAKQRKPKSKKEGGVGGSAFRNPYRTRPREVRQARRGFRQEGLRGKALRQKVKGFRREKKQEQKRAARELVPEEIRDYVNPRKYARKVLQGKEPYGPLKEWAGYRQLSEMGGYDQPETPLREHFLEELEAGAPVDYMREQSPTLGAISEYAQSRLGSGLTPEEEAAIRQRGKSAVESSYREGTRGEGTRLAMAGIDPRSGVASQKALQLERGRQQGLTGVESDITAADLERKGALENFARGVSGLEESGRQFDVGTSEQRQMGVEAGLGDLARLAESRRTYDIDTAEGQRQAKRARQASKKAAKQLEPGGLQQAGAILGGIFGGVGK